jgi:hypothetical protein
MVLHDAVECGLGVEPPEVAGESVGGVALTPTLSRTGVSPPPPTLPPSAL